MYIGLSQELGAFDPFYFYLISDPPLLRTHLLLSLRTFLSENQGWSGEWGASIPQERLLLPGSGSFWKLE